MSRIEASEQTPQVIGEQSKVVYLLDPSGEDVNVFRVASTNPLVLRDYFGVFCDGKGHPLSARDIASMAEVGILGD